MKKVLLVVAMALGGSPAFGFFSSGTTTKAAAYDKLATCTDKTGNVTSGGSTRNCGSFFNAEVQVDSDAKGLDYGSELTYTGCSIVDEVVSANEDNQCVDEGVSAFNENGVYGIVKWKLYHKKSTESFFRWVEKRFKKKHFARLDAYCGANGLPSFLLTYVTSPTDDFRVCGTNYCDNTFSSTNLPECNAACDKVETDNCGASQCVDPATLCSDSGGNPGYCSSTACEDDCNIAFETLGCKKLL